MINNEIIENNQPIDHIENDQPKENNKIILEYKKRMLFWNNPVEFVNNMYGSHPDDDDGGPDYFKDVFSK
jgi:hypothetical protein